MQLGSIRPVLHLYIVRGLDYIIPWCGYCHRPWHPIDGNGNCRRLIMAFWSVPAGYFQSELGRIDAAILSAVGYALEYGRRPCVQPLDGKLVDQVTEHLLLLPVPDSPHGGDTSPARRVVGPLERGEDLRLEPSRNGNAAHIVAEEFGYPELDRGEPCVYCFFGLFGRDRQVCFHRGIISQAGGCPPCCLVSPSVLR